MRALILILVLLIAVPAAAEIVEVEPSFFGPGYQEGCDPTRKDSYCSAVDGEIYLDLSNVIWGNCRSYTASFQYKIGPSAWSWQDISFTVVRPDYGWVSVEPNVYEDERIQLLVTDGFLIRGVEVYADINFAVDTEPRTFTTIKGSYAR